MLLLRFTFFNNMLLLRFAFFNNILLLRFAFFNNMLHYSDWVCTAVMSNDVMKDLRG